MTTDHATTGRHASSLAGPSRRSQFNRASVSLFRLAAPVFLLVLSVGPAQAQYPGQLTGRVTDALSGQPVETVWIEMLGTDLTALSDGLGEFRIAGLEPGRHSVRFSRLGYAMTTREVEIQNGATARLSVSLVVQPVGVEALRAEVDAREGPLRTPGVIYISRKAIEGSESRTAAELLEGHAGLVVQSRGPTGAQTVSIRGSSADQVLVLLDGAPLANPLTGIADLSAVPASAIETITVLKGSHSARFGPGAQAGAVLIESRTSAPPLQARIETGSLGTWAALAEASGGSGVRWTVGGQARTSDGDFTFRQPDVLGGGTTLRTNSNLSELSTHATLGGQIGEHGFRLRGGLARLDRGIPGTSFSPTPTAVEELVRVNAQAGWERVRKSTRLSAHLHALRQRNRFADPSPPVGPAYDSRTAGSSWGVRLSAETSGTGMLQSAATGLELNQLAVESTELDSPDTQRRFDYGAFASGRLAPFNSEAAPQLIAAVRLDRDAASRAWRLSHELALSAGGGPLSFQLRHSSSFRPPSFGDQFFREGVRVAPNPELRAERIPTELSLGATLNGPLAVGVQARIGLDAYIADVKDMIIWAPDFRFVWSPRNFDVKRRGLDVEAELSLPRRSLAFSARYGLARTVYDRPGPDTVQVMYRPRHTASLEANWSPARWDLGIDARYIGMRYPVPASLNALDPYWTVDVRIRHRFEAGTWGFAPSISIERLFDNQDSLIFGYPEPGRTIRLAIHVRQR